MRNVIPLALGAIVLATAAPADAQRRRRAPRVNVDEVTAQLNAGDAATIQAGIEQVGVSGSGRLVAPLAARIRRGLPPELLELAVETLGILTRPEAGPVLFELSTHRRGEIRQKAVEAIVACEPRGADRALESALSDSEGGVRAAAALGLGQLGAHGALDSLFLALDRDIMEASTAIGQVARASDVPRLMEYLGRYPFDALTPAFMELLARDDVPDATKIDVISRLAELATPDVKTFFEDFVSSLPERRGRDRVRDAAEAAIARIVS